MKTLKSYEKELKTCSKCGLCQSVCPIYKITGKETVISRGKFNLLTGLLNKDLKYNKKTDEIFSMCLNCKACDDFCPSSIKASEIILSAKCENKKINILNKSFLIFKLKMLCLGLIFKILHLINFSKIISASEYLIKKIGCLGSNLLLLGKISEINIKRKKTHLKTPKLKVIYFEGCYTKYFNPSIKNAVLNLLEKDNIEVIQKPFECCGLSALYDGNINLYKKLKEKNIKLLNSEYDYIVCDCATCSEALKNYNETICSKVIDITELLKNIKINSEANSATYHLPCHLRNDKDKIMRTVENVLPNYRQLIDNDVCCGFSGNFSLKYPKLSAQISKQKAENIINSGANYVLTSCPGCIIGLNKGLIAQKSSQKVLHIAEYLEKFS